MAATLSFDRLTKLMTVDLPDTEITMQEIHNQVREYSAELVNLSIEQMISSGGKEDLKNGSFVGITSTLLDDWQIAFAARPGPTWVQCEIKGGNIVAENVNGPIYNTPYVNVNYAASSSATLVSGDDLTNLENQVTDIQNRIPAALVSGMMDSYLSATGLSAAAVLKIANGLLDAPDGVEPVADGAETTVREALRVLVSSAAGVLTGAGTTNIQILNLNGTKTVIDATVDGVFGNRLIVSLDKT